MNTNGHRTSRKWWRVTQWVRELRRLDWRSVNRKTQMPFFIALNGGPDEVAELTRELMQFEHSLSERFHHLFERARTFQPDHAQSALRESSELAPGETPLFELVLSSQMPERSWPCYQWPKERAKQKELLELLLDQLPSYQYALAARLPAFRGPMMEREVLATVRLNTFWVTTSALPNLIPGPHQLMTAPLEASSDFVVLTLNELRLMMVLTGLMGLVIRPQELFTQAVIVLSMAKVAQMSATQLLSKLPAGAGIVVKGAVAYAFTRAIGEAIVLYLVTGRAQGKDFFVSRIDVWFKPGLSYIRNKLGK